MADVGQCDIRAAGEDPIIGCCKWCGTAVVRRTWTQVSSGKTFEYGTCVVCGFRYDVRNVPPCCEVELCRR